MAAPVGSVDKLLATERYKFVLSLVKGFRNGVVYGAKVRFPHSLVMTFLFKEGSLLEKCRMIARATFTHSRNLAFFTVLYKCMKRLLCAQSKKRPHHIVLMACCCGFLVFGSYNKINEQINLYLLSRTLYALAQLGVKKGYIPKPKYKPFPIFAAAVWGVALYLFEFERWSLQSSVQSSMTYLYEDSDIWHNFRDFLIYNQ